MQILTEREIEERLGNLNSWTRSGASIEKEFKLKDFSEALAFTIKVGIQAEKHDHHPDILMHSWNKVKITLSTHSAGGITENDFYLAAGIDKI